MLPRLCTRAILELWLLRQAHVVAQLNDSKSVLKVRVGTSHLPDVLESDRYLPRHGKQKSLFEEATAIAVQRLPDRRTAEGAN